ncbi:MAG: alcohol dehydrogenase catalytic domain-containing protein [Vicinamibacteraceae bacterium]
MRGLWLEDRRLRVRDDLPVPEPAAGDARIRVTLAGVCHTDLELVRGYYPYAGILGHEFVGVVDAAPSDPAWEGRRVVGEINATCGACPTCLAGRASHCERRTVLGIVGRDGAFADYLTLPIANLHAVPDAVPDEIAVFTEPVAAAFQILAQVDIGPGDRVVVFGDGKLGQVIAQALATTGCALTVVGRHPRKLAMLAARGIATQADLPAPRAADVVVECTGRREGLQAALVALRARGTLVLKSTFAGDSTLNLSAIVVDEITIVGSRCGPFAPALAALASGAIVVSPLIADRRSLADGIDALARAAAPGTLKVLLVP